MQRSAVRLGMLGLAAFSAAGALSAEQPSSANAIAVVGSLTGVASFSQGTSRKPLALFDWIAEGSEITLPAGSNLTLVLADGRRFALEGESRVRMASAGPELVRGKLQTLEPVPPLPRLSGIAPAARPGTRSGALRVRGEGLHGLYPHAGVAALPDSTVLRFPVADPVGVEIQDESGKRVFQVETRVDCVPVPQGVLDPGKWYHWGVQEPKERGSSPLAEAEFFTLARVDLERRAALKARLESQGDAGALALVAAVDRRLGLLAESRAELVAALAKAPRDVELSRVLEDMDRELGFPQCRPISSP
jgi:hypothetical protein